MNLINNISDLSVTNILVDFLKYKKNSRFIFLDKDENHREISIHKLNSCQFLKSNLFYPSVILFSEVDQKYYKVINERIMSLGDHIGVEKIELNNKTNDISFINDPLFFFVYNTDNYYHFIYDSLPYLISFFYLKKYIPGLKLLMNYPTPQSQKFYNFVLEFLNILNINNSDIEIIDSKKNYKEIYISSSFTHDIDSNKPPRSEIYNFYKKIVNKTKTKFTNNLPKKIYISRRSWLHNDLSNIGTNYTSRRNMVSENLLVKYLESKGFTEVFTEKLNTIEKLDLFNNVDYVVGAIGGGLCNVLFSPKSTKLLTIVSPTFLDVNYRFKYSIDNVQNNYFTQTYHIEKTEYKKYMRVKCLDKIVGEIKEVGDEKIKVMYTNDIVSGWNSNSNFSEDFFNKSNCKPIDNGLNSSWDLNLKNFKKYESILFG